MISIYEPQRNRDFHDHQTGLSVWCADNGNGDAWLEIETTDNQGEVTGTLKLDARQAAVLGSEVLDDAVPNLRGEWFWKTRGRAFDADGVARQIAGMKVAGEKPPKPQPTIEERYAAKTAREQRLTAAEWAVKKAQDSVDWSRRYERIAAQLTMDLQEAQQLDAGLDMAPLETELVEVNGYIELLPGQEKALAEARIELKAAKAWGGFNHE